MTYDLINFRLSIVTQNANTNWYNNDSTYYYYNAITGISENTNTNSQITISPNPFTSSTTISFNEEQKNTTIKIMDVMSREIKTIHFSGKEYVIEKGEMSKGIYFVRITDGNKNVMNRKIVLQ